MCGGVQKVKKEKERRRKEGKEWKEEKVSVLAEMGGCCLVGIEQNFGEGGGEVGRGWAEQWACFGWLEDRAESKNEGRLEREIVKKTSKRFKNGAFRVKQAPKNRLKGE